MKLAESQQLPLPTRGRLWSSESSRSGEGGGGGVSRGTTTRTWSSDGARPSGFAPSLCQCGQCMLRLLMRHTRLPLWPWPLLSQPLPLPLPQPFSGARKWDQMSIYSQQFNSVRLLKRHSDRHFSGSGWMSVVRAVRRGSYCTLCPNVFHCVQCNTAQRQCCRRAQKDAQYVPNGHLKCSLHYRLHSSFTQTWTRICELSMNSKAWQNHRKQQ